jgi:hypothetical protein
MIVSVIHSKRSVCIIIIIIIIIIIDDDDDNNNNNNNNNNIGSKAHFRVLAAFSLDPIVESVRRMATTYTQYDTNTEKCTLTSIPRDGFEPTVSVIVRVKTVYALDCSGAVKEEMQMEKFCCLLF